MGEPGGVSAAVPGHDPADPVESAVIARLAGNWHRRAAVKRDEPDLDELFEPGRPDYPEALLPFRDHPVYRELPQDAKSRLLSWGWITFNKNIMDIEQIVVGPAFELLAREAFDTGLPAAMRVAMTQGMVDEQYHTLMHLNASMVTRRRRGAAMPDAALPLAHKPRTQQARLAAAGQRWQRELAVFAFATVAEISINALLDLVAKDEAVQPVNRATADLHNRDEYCHAAILDEVAKGAFRRFGPEQRRYFLDALAEGLGAFAANDFSTWRRVLALEGVAGGARMLDEVEHDPHRARLLQDFRGLYALCEELGVTEELGFDWSTVVTR